MIIMLSILSAMEESICSSEEVYEVAFAVLCTAATSFTSSESEHLYSVTACCFDLHPARRIIRKMIAVAMMTIICGLLFLYMTMCDLLVKEIRGNQGKISPNFCQCNLRLL